MGKDETDKVFQASTCIKRFTQVYEKFQRNLKNGYVSRSMDQPHDAIEANMKMDH